MNNYLIKSATLADGTITDVVVFDGSIKSLKAEDGPGLEIIDAKGLMLFGGFVDMHTHLREPGFEQSETILSGSKAAAKGGFTGVNAMANTSPVADNAAVVELVSNLGKQAGYVEVQPIGAVTKNLHGEQLADLASMNSSSANVRVFSDDGNCVSDSLLMRRALEYVRDFGGTIAQHAQDPSLTKGAQMNESELSFRLGLPGWPATAEASIVARDVLLTEQTGSKLHVCHVSTKETVDVLRWAKARGIAVTAEVTPHHLMLTEDLVSEYNTLFKVNPPLRNHEDVAAVRTALADGTIDIVATDHAPHPDESKACEWSAAANGMIGLESAASVVIKAMIETKLMNWVRFEEVMSKKPAEIAGMKNQGHGVVVGSPANLVLLDPASTYLVSPDSQSLSKNNPYVGLELPGQIRHVFFNGVATVRDGKLVEIR